MSPEARRPRRLRDGALLSSALVALALAPLSTLFAPPAAAQAGDDPLLTHFTTITLRGDYVARGAGMLEQESATIVIDEIPDDAELVGIVVYWAYGLSNPSPSARAMRLNDVVIRGEEAGPPTGGPWAPPSVVLRGLISAKRLSELSYQPVGGPLPPAPPGNGTYVLTALGDERPLGATLVLVYRREGDPVRDLVFTDGNARSDVTPPPPFRRELLVRIENFLAAEPGLAKSTYVVGRGDWPNDRARFDYSSGARLILWGGPFDSSDGPSWDTEHVPLTYPMLAGEYYGHAAVETVAERVGHWFFTFDELVWAAHILSVTSANEPDPDPGTIFTGGEALASRTPPAMR